MDQACTLQGCLEKYCHLHCLDHRRVLMKCILSRIRGCKQAGCPANRAVYSLAAHKSMTGETL